MLLQLSLIHILQKLNNTVLQAKGIAQKHNCQLVPLDFQQVVSYTHLDVYKRQEWDDVTE